MFRILNEDEKALLTEWHKHPGAAIARRVVIERREADEAALGKALYRDPAAYDPMKVALAAGEYRRELRELNVGAFAAHASERTEREEVTELD